MPSDSLTTNLFVQRVQQLLAGCRTGKGGSFVERAAESTTIQKAFARAVEGNTETIHQIDDLGSPERHLLDRRLMIQEITAVDGIVKVLPLVVAKLTGLVVATVDSTLGKRCANA